ncbi:MAG: hypothetical protein ABI844_13670, partial [Saprospiraceae bacterium]
ESSNDNIESESSSDGDQEDDEDEIKENFNFNLKQGDLLSTDKMKQLFPKSLDRLDRESIKAESTGAFGIKIATVKSVYRDNDKSVKLEIIDFGGIPGVAQMIAAWSKSDIYHEDEDGFEKVTEWKGHKAFEKSDLKDNSSSIAILYKNRFLINASADGMAIGKLKDALDDSFMDELDDLKID